MLVKSIATNVLPAAPCDAPSFTPSDLVGHGGGPPAAAGCPVGAEVAGAVAGPAGVAGAVAVAVSVTVLVGPATGADEPPQAAMSTAKEMSAVTAIARLAWCREESIAGLLLRGQAPPAV
jgi:hypothetical protein